MAWYNPFSWGKTEPTTVTTLPPPTPTMGARRHKTRRGRKGSKRYQAKRARSGRKSIR